MKVQQELMRHASIQTTMNIYWTSDDGLQAQGKPLFGVLNATCQTGLRQANTPGRSRVIEFLCECKNGLEMSEF